MRDARFIIIAGKGGVGRTTVAAALGTLLARRGRRVLLAHVRTRQRVGRMLGLRREIDEEIRPVETNLWAVNMNPRAALREHGLQILRFRAVYRAVMENRLVRHFLRAVPSLDEYSLLGKAWFHTTERVHDRPRFDTVIFDGPATGHLLTMLQIPQVILDTVPEGPLTRDAGAVRAMLIDPAATQLWIVTLAEEMPVSESVELYEAARDRLHIMPTLLVVNAVYPGDFEAAPWLSEALDRLRPVTAREPGLAPLVESADTLRSRRLINRHYLDLLDRTLPLPKVELPYIFAPELGRPAIDALAARLEEALFPPDAEAAEAAEAEEP